MVRFTMKSAAFESVKSGVDCTNLRVTLISVLPMNAGCREALLRKERCEKVCAALRFNEYHGSVST